MSNVEQEISNGEVQRLLVLRRSTFVIRPARDAFKQMGDQFPMTVRVAAPVVLRGTSHGRRAFCGSLLTCRNL